MNWFDANDLCKTEGGKLAEIDSKEENTALVEEMIKQGYTWKNMHFWMGLTDRGSEGDRRLKSNDMEPSFTKLGPSEPNNGPGSLLKDEKCAKLGGRVGNWNDVDCFMNTTKIGIKKSLHALCEFEDSVESSSTVNPLVEGSKNEKLEDYSICFSV